MPRNRVLVARAGLVAALVVLLTVLWRLSDPARTPPDDFVAFWSAARLYAEGGDPYDPAALLRLEREAGWRKDHAYRVWNPPWALPLLLPLAALPYQAGRLVWFGVHLAAILLSAGWLWEVYGGSRRRRGRAWLIALAFAPTVIAWRTGQLTPLVLLGVSAALVLERRHRSAAAGAALALAAIKPQLLVLVWLDLARRWVRTRHRQPLLAMVATVGALGALAAAIAPAVLGDFVRAAATAPPRQLASTLGTALRLGAQQLLGRDPYWLLFVPTGLGALWLLARRDPDRSRGWTDELPLLVLVSLVVAPFGWVYDEALILIAVLQIAAGLDARDRAWPASVLASYVALNAVVLGMNVLGVHPFWYVWTPTAFLLWYARAARAMRACPAARHAVAAVETAGDVG